MTLLQSVNELRYGFASSGLDELVEAISDHLSDHVRGMEPEEQDHTRFILERLLDLQAAAVRSATTRGATMAERQAQSLERAA